MKKPSLLISAALLSLIAGVQTAMAQKVTLYSAGSKAYECDIAQLDSIVFSEAQTIPAEEIVVTVDANGNADGGHLFSRIDETTFLIDGLKYKYESGDLTVIGYDPVFFSGVAKIISKLIYNGRTMNVVSIGNESFKKCANLTSVTIGSGVTSIGDGAFWGCSSLTSVIIGSGVTSIGNFVFSYCSSLTSITIPNSVTSIDNSAFEGCNSLTSFIIPNSVTSIGASAFRGCSILTSITIPNNVTSIGDSAFCDCSSLTSVTIPSSVTSIGGFAFYNCIGLTSVTIGSGVTSIGGYAFRDCSSLTSITIPESVTSIGYYAFSGCDGLTSVTIPEGVTSIGYRAFSGCSSLTSIIVEGDNTVYDSRNNCNAIIETATNTLIAGCKNTAIPESVTSIYASAFSGCSGLTSITIPESVTSIGEFAFSGCSNLTDLYCYAKNVPSTRSDAFDGFPISSATLHVPAGSVDAYKATSPWNFFKSIVAIE